MTPSGSRQHSETLSKEQSQAILRGWLAWYEAIGVDCAVGEESVNHFAESAKRRPAASPPQPQKFTVAPRELPATATEGGSKTRDLPLPATANAVTEAERRALAAADLAQLRDAITGFDLCGLRATASNTVFGEGIDQEPDVMIIGEAPGADEDRLGQPFVGQSGRLLDRMLAEVGLSRQHNIFISNMVFWRPPGNRPPTDLEVAMCQPFMLRMIQLVKPRVILAVGNTPSRALLGKKDGIVKLRGKWVMDRTYGGDHAIPTLATFHPAYLLRSPGQKKLVWQDVLTVRIFLENSAREPNE
ncbi:MAG: uracil-DNA glycosylase [Alphaproteobacteria bacterium]|nr:uracil-DNA glycosylase [Alphaproteobacteria bacterium]